MQRLPSKMIEHCVRERRRKSAAPLGESYRRKPAGWNESAVGAARNGAPVVTLRQPVSIRHSGLRRADLICRTAVYVIRTHGGVGGRGREASYPDYAAGALTQLAHFRST